MELTEGKRTQPAATNDGLHFFQGAKEFSVGNQYNIGEQKILNTGTLLDLLNPIPNASYTRNRKLSPPDSSCLPGTRKDVIQKVVDWVDSSLLLKDSHVMWLYGYVGCGKSAIAQAVAERYARKKRLAASFFFFRGSGDRSRVGRFAATVASQVAASIPSTASTIEAAAKAHAGLLDPSMSLGAQFQHLVYNPIDAVKWAKLGLNMLKGPYLIVIDGLDECDDREEIASFIDHMLEFFRKNPRLPLRFLITSRVEEHLRTRLNNSSQVHLVNLVDHTTLDDIATAMRASFDLAAKHDRALASYGTWPIPSDFQQLVRHTGCSFIFMATIVKYILEPAGDELSPLDRLPFVLNINPGLDGLYSQTLARSQHLPHFGDIIATIALARIPLSVINLADLLNIETFKVIPVLVNLHAILQVPGDDNTPITLCHTSLRDFLLDEFRSGPLCAPMSHHERLAYRCIEVLSGIASLPDHNGTSSSDYAANSWKYHWGRMCQTLHHHHKPAEDRKHLTMLAISQLRESYPNDFAVVVASYILADFDIPSHFQPSTRTQNRSMALEIEAYVEFLQPITNEFCSRVILEAVALVLGPCADTRHALLDLWKEVRPPLPDLKSFHYTIVTVGRHHLLRNLVYPSPSGLRMRFTQTCASRYSRYIFSWLFFNWANHFVLALNDDRTLDWSSISEESPLAVVTGNSGTGDRTVQELVRRLYMKDSWKDKERFLGGVRSALEAASSRALREFSLEPNLPTQGSSWRWETSPNVDIFFGSTSSRASCWDVLAMRILS
ncbi:hypothetical protein DFP72DRAFT_364413 [Ephemerocybe angulata]|uniref:NACHT domain-containing protein n=1 Tax=Ephemerocybe angulata TaxID=980116 RepID=A0A8H6M405_9AGAR|nr:hypothetical protein DFP72DRAFT_364413 [Tulosesus angulatus]